MNEKDKAIVQALASIQNRLRHVYNQGFEDGRKAERKTGKWVHFPNVWGVVFCSECNYDLRINDTKYCPNCGAKMEVDDADSN